MLHFFGTRTAFPKSPVAFKCLAKQIEFQNRTGFEKRRLPPEMAGSSKQNNHFAAP